VNFLNPECSFFSVGKVAMNAPRYWELCDDACTYDFHRRHSKWFPNCQ
jgi:hypothetical protein